MSFDLFEKFFPADASNSTTGVRENINEYFVIFACRGSEFLGSSKNLDQLKSTARYFRDDCKIPDVSIKRIRL